MTLKVEELQYSEEALVGIGQTRCLSLRGKGNDQPIHLPFPCGPVDKHSDLDQVVKMSAGDAAAEASWDCTVGAAVAVAAGDDAVVARTCVAAANAS